jgi:hypothetical protein
MTPPLTLLRPDASIRSEVGNDGLTEAERTEYANAYRVGAGRKSLSTAEKDAFLLWHASRAKP